MRLGRLAMTVAAPLVVLSLAGCGGAGSGDNGPARPAGGGSGPSSPAADPGQRALQFAQCMREHGVDMPDPDPNNRGQIQLGPPGTDTRKVQEAAQACRAFSPIGNADSGNQTPAQKEARLKFAQCMREHGVENWPDPSDSQQGPMINGPGMDDPDFESASQTCAPILRGAFGDTF